MREPDKSVNDSIKSILSGFQMQIISCVYAKTIIIILFNLSE